MSEATPKLDEDQTHRSWSFAQAMRLENKNDALVAIVTLAALVVAITKEDDIGKLLDQYLPPLHDNETKRAMVMEVVPVSGPPHVPVSIRVVEDRPREGGEPGFEREFVRRN